MKNPPYDHSFFRLVKANSFINNKRTEKYNNKTFFKDDGTKDINKNHKLLFHFFSFYPPKRSFTYCCKNTVVSIFCKH